MDRDIEFLEFLKTEKKAPEILDEFGYTTGINLLKKYLEEGFIEHSPDKKIVINKKGEKHLVRIRKEKENGEGFKFRDIKGKNVALQFGGRRNTIKQENIGEVPRQEISPFVEIISKIAEKVGIKESLWVLGILGLGGTGFWGYNFYISFNRITIATFDLFDKSILISGVIGALGFLCIIGFFVLLIINKLERCKKCGTLLGYTEQGDGKVIAKSLDGRIKVKRKYVCQKCKDNYEIIKWENIKNSLKS